jgi:hypothetical protein
MDIEREVVARGLRPFVASNAADRTKDETLSNRQKTLVNANLGLRKETITKLAIDKDSVHYVSFMRDKVAEIVNRELDLSDKTVYEMFGGVGGDTCQLARFAPVTTFEIDENRFISLSNNVEQLKGPLSLKPVQVNHGSGMRVNEHYDVFFVDPPWGDYLETGVISVNRMTPLDMFYCYRGLCRWMVFKLPLLSKYDPKLPAKQITVTRTDAKGEEVPRYELWFCRGENVTFE